MMIKVYITDLDAYNQGSLIGKWIKLPMGETNLEEAIDDVLCTGASECGDSECHEEVFITDYEWSGHQLHEIHEYADIYALNEELQLLEDKSDYELKSISFLLLEMIAIDIKDAISKAENVTIYENYTMEDIAYDFMHENYLADQLPSIISNNLDYTGIAKELEYEGFFFEVGSDIYEYSG